MDHASVSGIMGKGGTILGSARCLEFHERKVRTKVIHLLKAAQRARPRRQRW
jgi:6-phosphofructokinase 1